MQIGDILQLDGYIIKQKIGSSYFSEVYRCIKKSTNKEYALKIYVRKSKGHTIENQILAMQKMLPKLQERKVRNIRVPYIVDYNSEGDNPYIIMELCGKSLQQILQQSRAVFDVSKVLMIGYALIQFVEAMHSIGFIHRDLKPSNILIGAQGYQDTLYVIDFGLSISYLKPNSKHIQLSTNKTLTGSSQFTSLFSYEKLTFARRDQIQVIANILIYLKTGCLPWLSEEIAGLPQQLRRQQIAEIKKKVSVKVLCKDLPIQIQEIYQHSRLLLFEETPNYEYIKCLLLKCMKNNSIEVNQKLAINLH